MKETGAVHSHWNLPWLTTVQESLMTEFSSRPVLFAGTSTIDPFTSSPGSLVCSRARVSVSIGSVDRDLVQIKMIKHENDQSDLTLIAAELHFTEGKLPNTTH